MVVKSMNDRMYEFEQTINFRQFLDRVDGQGDTNIRTIM